MLGSQKHMLRLSEIRQRLNELAGKDEALTTEETSEVLKLRNEMSDVETRYQAAIQAESSEITEQGNGTTETPEKRELEELENRASIGAIAQAVIDDRTTEGPEAELQKELGLTPKQIPLSMLIEKRAATPAPANVHVVPHEVVPAIFPQSVAAFLGVLCRP